MTTTELTRPVANPLAAIDCNAEPYVKVAGQRKSLEKIFAETLERKSSLELSFTEKPIWRNYRRVQPQDSHAIERDGEESAVDGFFGRLKRAIAGILR